MQAFYIIEHRQLFYIFASYLELVIYLIINDMYISGSELLIAQSWIEMAPCLAEPYHDISF